MYRLHKYEFSKVCNLFYFQFETLYIFVMLSRKTLRNIYQINTYISKLKRKRYLINESKCLFETERGT